MQSACYIKQFRNDCGGYFSSSSAPSYLGEKEEVLKKSTFYFGLTV
jgi:hypothetical protein